MWEYLSQCFVDICKIFHCHNTCHSKCCDCELEVNESDFGKKELEISNVSID